MRQLRQLFGGIFVWMFCAQSAMAAPLICVNHEPIDGRYFGMHIHRFHNPKIVPTVEFGSWRLWDAGVAWQNLQPSKDSWDFRRLELALSIAERRGVEVGLVLGMTPQWAAARPNERSFGGEGAASEPRDFADWDHYVRTVAQRYKGRIHFYEIWNEPNTSGYFTGTLPQLVELARRTYQIVKEVDPQAIVVSPSAAKASSLPWLTQYAAAGGLRYADVVGYHFYTDSRTPEDLIPLVASVRAVLAKRDVNKPLWNTESGVANDGTPNTGLNIGPAAHVARWLILGACLGLERFHYYAWDNTDLGLFDPNQLSLRPQALAYGQVHKWLTGAKITSCELGQEITKCSLNKQKKTYSILWTGRDITLGETGNYEYVEDSFGTMITQPMAALPLGASPILAW